MYYDFPSHWIEVHTCAQFSSNGKCCQNVVSEIRQSITLKVHSRLREKVHCKTCFIARFALKICQSQLSICSLIWCCINIVRGIKMLMCPPKSGPKLFFAQLLSNNFRDILKMKVKQKIMRTSLAVFFTKKPIVKPFHVESFIDLLFGRVLQFWLVYSVSRSIGELAFPISWSIAQPFGWPIISQTTLIKFPAACMFMGNCSLQWSQISAQTLLREVIDVNKRITLVLIPFGDLLMTRNNRKTAIK